MLTAAVIVGAGKPECAWRGPHVIILHMRVVNIQVYSVGCGFTALFA